MTRFKFDHHNRPAKWVTPGHSAQERCEYLHAQDPDQAASEPYLIIQQFLKAQSQGPLHQHALEIARLRQLVEEQGRILRQHQEILSVPEMPPLGAFEKWCETPEAAEYAGNHVAFVFGKGVIKSSPSLGALLSQLGPKHGATIGYVPGA